MSADTAAGGGRGHPLPPPADGGTLAFVESPVQLLNVLEWARQPGHPRPESQAHPESHPQPGALALPAAGTGPVSGSVPADRPEPPTAPGEPEDPGDLTVVVLPPGNDPLTRGQLRRMVELALDEGVPVRWEEARGGAGAMSRTLRALAGPLRRARRVVIGDPFSRYVQLLLALTRAPRVVVVDDGTATMEFLSLLSTGERLVRWHRSGAGGVPALAFAPVSARARRRLLPLAGHRRVEVFSAMPVDTVPDGVSVRHNDFGWTRSRFGPPRLVDGTDLVGTSLVETGVVHADRYLAAVAALTRRHGATRYFAHRRESAEKLRGLSAETGLEVVRPELPLEVVARRGPIGRTILSFPSTVLHTLPLALHGTGVRVAVCEVDPTWLTDRVTPRARSFLSGVTGRARHAHRLPS